MTARVESVLTKLGIEFNPRPKNNRIWGICPYHDDHHANNWFIRVNHERYGQHHCFACENGGGLVDLVAHVRGITINAAKDWLQNFDDQVAEVEDVPDAVGIELITNMHMGFQIPREVIFEPLEEWVTPARDFMHKRGITATQVSSWKLGYAVDGRLAGRIVIPVWDLGYELIPYSYQARDFCDREKRYLYPSSDERPNLDVMFGELGWAYKERDVVVVTEGAFNALAVERANGEVRVAAIGGSQLRPAHVLRLSTFRRVLVLTDSDLAGDKIADKLMTALHRHTEVKRVRLLDNTDANEYPQTTLASVLAHALRKV